MSTTPLSASLGHRGAQHVVGAQRVDVERVQPGGDVGVLDVGERDHRAGEHHGIETAEGVGSLVDHPRDRRGVLDVEFERMSPDTVGEGLEQFDTPRRHRDIDATLGGTFRDGVSDARRGTDDEETQAGRIGWLAAHSCLPTSVLVTECVF